MSNISATETSTCQTIDSRNHSFNVGIAIDYSPDMALWIGHLAFFMEYNLSINKNIHDGLCWTYDTLDALVERMPYFSRRQLETIINNSVKEALVQKGNYNQTGYDRTCWYALTPKAYTYFQHLLSDKYLKRLFNSISPNCEMDFTELCNRFRRNVTTIPATDPATNLVNKNNDENTCDIQHCVQIETIPIHSMDPPVHIVSDSDSTEKYRAMDSNGGEREKGKIISSNWQESTYDLAYLDASESTSQYLPGFEAFWSEYPARSKPALTRALWIEYGLEADAIQIIDKLKLQKELHVRWKKKEYIPSPVNYLKNEGWKDDIIEATKENKATSSGNTAPSANTRGWVDASFKARLEKAYIKAAPERAKNQRALLKNKIDK
ncbi:MAG: hypothetical protein ACRC1W_09695 [Shewanella sp.]